MTYQESLSSNFFSLCSWRLRGEIGTALINNTQEGDYNLLILAQKNCLHGLRPILLQRQLIVQFGIVAVGLNEAENYPQG